MNKTIFKPYAHYIVALVIGLVIRFVLSPGNGLTQAGVSVLAITIPTLYLWLTCNTHWSSLLFLAMLIMTQVMTPNEVWAGSMGHFSVITMIVFMLLNVCLNETGVIKKISIWFITRKFVYKRPYVFLFMFYLSHWVIGLFVDNLSLAVIYVGLAINLCESIGVKKGESFYTCMFLPILWCNVIVAIASPIAHNPVNILMGIMETTIGVTVTYGQWLRVGIPYAIIMFLAIMVAVAIWHPDTSKFMEFDVDNLKKEDKPLSKEGKIAAVVMVVVLLFILLPELLTNILPGFSAYFRSIGVVVPAILGVVALCIIRVNDKPILNAPKALQQIPIAPAIFAGVVCVMSVPFSSEATGITIWIGNILKPAISGLPDFAVMTLLGFFALVMTNFMSNVVTMVLFFNIGVAILSTSSINLGAYAIFIGVAAAIATVTPSACVPAPLFFGDGHVKVGNSLKANIVFVVLSFIVMLAYVYPACVNLFS